MHLAPALLEWNSNAPRDEEATAAVDIGAAFHCLLLEPERFEAEYAADFVPPAGALVTIDHIKAFMDDEGVGYKASDSKGTLTEKLLAAIPDAPLMERLRAEWTASLGGRTVLTATEMRKLLLMRASVMAHPFARKLIEAEGDVEASIYWTDPETCLLCRCRPDKIARGLKLLVDVKTTADMDRFAASIHDYRYHVQDAYYSEGYERHFGEPPRGFLLLVVSTTRDAGRYPVRLFALTPDDRSAGRGEFRADLETVANCQRTGVWPGIELISRPEWARRRAAA